MKIEDMQTLPEFFGVESGESVWIEGREFIVRTEYLVDRLLRYGETIRALVGCLTGQLKWSKHEPITEGEKKILREIAAWFPHVDSVSLDREKDIVFIRNGSGYYYFEFRAEKSKAYEILAPILEKYGEINLDEYRESN